MPAARKPATKKSKSKAKVKVKTKARLVVKPKTKAKLVAKAKAVAKPKVQPKMKPKPKAVAKPKTAPKPAAKKPPPKPRAVKTSTGLMPNHQVAARLLRHAAELFIAVGKQNPKAEKTMILRAKIIETAADRVEADPMGGFEPIEGDEL